MERNLVRFLYVLCMLSSSYYNVNNVKYHRISLSKLASVRVSCVIIIKYIVHDDIPQPYKRTPLALRIHLSKYQLERKRSARDRLHPLLMSHPFYEQLPSNTHELVAG